ncbi:hypothetical protein PCL_03756 [Purpureocillium lilacinum]|uniref:Uncharacterized protein n=1 Tax=Purpureocillium lilacinum TaxID=33203 RepID=A0A2U3EPY6_PURLI|nr:hypothetical protein PCL_03756 [Purpureocillium lilacinum]
MRRTRRLTPAAEGPKVQTGYEGQLQVLHSAIHPPKDGHTPGNAGRGLTAWRYLGSVRGRLLGRSGWLAVAPAQARHCTALRRAARALAWGALGGRCRTPAQAAPLLALEGPEVALQTPRRHGINNNKAKRIGNAHNNCQAEPRHPGFTANGVAGRGAQSPGRAGRTTRTPLSPPRYVHVPPDARGTATRRSLQEPVRRPATAHTHA